VTRPVLGTLELTQVQHLTVDEADAPAIDRVPGLDGDFADSAGRRSHRIVVTGVLSGPSAADDLDQLRAAFLDAAPLPFTSDIAAATRLDRVVIEGLLAREMAGEPERVEYVLALREHVPAATAEQRAPEPPSGAVDEAAAQEAVSAAGQQAAAISGQRGTLEVTIELGDGGNGAGRSGIVVRVEPDGQAPGSAAGYSAFSDQPADGVYRFTDVPAGSYQVRAELR
jgi:hypothetical protein